MNITTQELIVRICLMLLGGLIGVTGLGLSTFWLPKILNALTPHINEEKAIAKGNVAVAIYFGLLVAGAILGLSIIIAAAIIAAMFNWAA